MAITAWFHFSRLVKWRAYWPLMAWGGIGVLLLLAAIAIVGWQLYRQSHQLAQLEQQYQLASQQSQQQLADANWWKNHQSAWQLLKQKGWFEDHRETLLRQLTVLKANASLGIESFHLSTSYPVIKQVTPEMGLWASRLTVVAAMPQEEQGFAVLAVLEKLDPLAKLVSCEWRRGDSNESTLSQALTLNCEMEKYFFAATVGV